jgi:two-component system, OmpR family, phosphate regulon response regulator OmpR
VNERHLALIIEDESFWSAILERALLQIGVASRVARDAAQARRELLAGHFDVILVDLVLPGQEGLGLVQEISRNPELAGRAVIVTAHSHVAGYVSGGIPVIGKNRLEDLIPHLIRIIGEPSAIGASS